MTVERLTSYLAMFLVRLSPKKPLGFDFLSDFPLVAFPWRREFSRRK